MVLQGLDFAADLVELVLLLLQRSSILVELRLLARELCEERGRVAARSCGDRDIVRGRRKVQSKIEQHDEHCELERELREE